MTDEIHGTRQQDVSSTFNILSTKNAAPERLRKWREKALVLNSTRRFRHTLDLKKEKENNNIEGKIKEHFDSQQVRQHDQEAAEQEQEQAEVSEFVAVNLRYTPISKDKLVAMLNARDVSALQKFGGVAEIAKQLNTDLKKGLSENEEELLGKKTEFGSNTYPQKKGQSFWRFLLDACRNKLLLILVVVVVASLALCLISDGTKHGWSDAVRIIIAVFLVILVTGFSDYRQSRHFQNLMKEKRNIRVEVIRGGRRSKVSINDIVVGDVLPLKIGDKVPAEGVYISSHALAIDERNRTGGSEIVTKNPESPFLRLGSTVADGYGTMLVTSVGVNTEWAMLMACSSEDTGEETPLQVWLNGLATNIGWLGIYVSFAILFIRIVVWYGLKVMHQSKAGEAKFSSVRVLKIITDCLAFCTVAVHEGLPLFVSFTLAYSMRKMMSDKALVRRLSACETMGSVTTICSDKTNLSQMATVVEAYVNDDKVDPPNDASRLSNILSTLLTEGIALNTTGSIFNSEGSEDEISGSPTEKAILLWGLKLGLKFDERRSASEIIHANPFNSKRKRGGVAVRPLQPGSDIHIHWMGAAEIVLASCTKFMDKTGHVAFLVKKIRSTFETIIQTMASKKLHCIAIAWRKYAANNVPSDKEKLAGWVLPDDQLTLLAIVGIEVAWRPGDRDSVELCRAAGVKVCMVTGDNLQTAKDIALECGILASANADAHEPKLIEGNIALECGILASANADADEPKLIEGNSFRSKSEAEREEIAEQISVMGRSSPEDKLLLVRALKKRGHVVAFTGYRRNDAPALREADIGLAMGIDATEVAKESSDIIILEDNFASVVKVVRWGRSVYANIQKFIQFHLTVTIVAVVINVVAACATGEVPLNALQLLWINLIMDTLGAFALGIEPPTDKLMQRPPIDRRKPLITNIMWRNILIQVVYQVVALLLIYFHGIKILDIIGDQANEVKNTVVFNAFVFCQIFNKFNVRKPEQVPILEGILCDVVFIVFVTITVIFQFIIVEFKLTSTVRLRFRLWVDCFLIGFASWPVALFGRFIPVFETPVCELLKSWGNSLKSWENWKNCFKYLGDF